MVISRNTIGGGDTSFVSMEPPVRYSENVYGTTQRRNGQTPDGGNKGYLDEERRMRIK